jgi:outer membrane protein assembly factor BamB
MQRVEVLDEDLVPAPRAGPGHIDERADGEHVAAGGLRWAPIRSRTGRLWAVAVVLGLVVVTGAVAAVGAQRDRARSDRLAAVPGVVRPLDGPPSTLWEVPASAGDALLVALDRVVVVRARGAEWRASGLDATSGHEDWTAVLAPTDRSGVEGGGVWCPEHGGDVGALVVCAVVPAQPVYRDDTGAQGVGGAAGSDATGDLTGTVVALSADDGGLLGTWTFEGELAGAGRAGGDVVLVTLDAEGFARAERRDGVTGEPRWTWTSPEPVLDPPGQTEATIEVTPSLVVVQGSATAVLAVDDGRALLTTPMYSFTLAQPRRVGFATWSPLHGGEVHDATGATVSQVPGLPARLAVDDGSERALVLLDQGNDVAAYDERTGVERWRTPSSLGPVAVVDHRVVVASGSRYAVLDARTGERLWEEDLGVPLPWTPVVDGALVLGPGVDADGRGLAVGRGLVDGVRHWSVPLPLDTGTGTAHVRAIAGHLLVASDETFRGLG